MFVKDLINVISYDHAYDEAASFESLSAGIHHFNVQVKGEMQKGPRTVSYSICPNFDSLWLG